VTQGERPELKPQYSKKKKKKKTENVLGGWNLGLLFFIQVLNSNSIERIFICQVAKSMPAIL
jgi:hypothetical protein